MRGGVKVSFDWFPSKLESVSQGQMPRVTVFYHLTPNFKKQAADNHLFIIMMRDFCK